MENMKKILFVLVLFFFSLDISYAECDFTENNKINSLAFLVCLEWPHAWQTEQFIPERF